MATDRLNLTQALEAAGIPRDGSEKVATAIFEAISDNVATKADLQTAVGFLRQEIASNTSELKHLVTVGNSNINNRIDPVHLEIRHVEHQLYVRLVGVIVFSVAVGCGAVIGAMHWWPPHQ